MNEVNTFQRSGNRGLLISAGVVPIFFEVDGNKVLCRMLGSPVTLLCSDVRSEWSMTLEHCKRLQTQVSSMLLRTVVLPNRIGKYRMCQIKGGIDK